MQSHSKFLLSSLILIGVLGYRGRAANAADNINNLTSSCVPDAATVQAGNMETAGHGIKFKTGASGTIRLICPINILRTAGYDGTWDNLIVHYQDPDGWGSHYEVKARLREATIGSTVSSVLWGATSNDNYITVYTTMNSNIYGTRITPSNSNWYWIEIIMTRDTGYTGAIEVLGYALD